MKRGSIPAPGAATPPRIARYHRPPPRRLAWRSHACHEDLRRHPTRPRAQLAARGCRGPDPRASRDPDRRPLRGKRKPTYTPHIDTGDFVVVDQRRKISVTGNKRAEKRYYRHSGYPGRPEVAHAQRDARPSARRGHPPRRAGMLPRNRLARKQITKLKIYAGRSIPPLKYPPPRTRVGHLFGATVEHLVRACATSAAGRARVAVVALLGALVARHGDVLRVDHDEKSPVSI